METLGAAFQDACNTVWDFRELVQYQISLPGGSALHLFTKSPLFFILPNSQSAYDSCFKLARMPSYDLSVSSMRHLSLPMLLLL